MRFEDLKMPKSLCCFETQSMKERKISVFSRAVDLITIKLIGENIIGVLMLFVVGFYCQSPHGDVRLPNIFCNHMVMQQGKALVVWGWSETLEKITVSIASKTQQVRANQKGEWKVGFPAMKTSGTYVLKIVGFHQGDEVKYEDVLIGEAWLCSGQSNMERGVKLCQDSQGEIEAANYPQIRLLKVERQLADNPQTNFQEIWKVCTPQTVAEGEPGGFTAVGFFYSRDLHQNLGVPVGLIQDCWSGTRIESWIPPEKFASTPALGYEHGVLQLRDPVSPQHRVRLQRTIDEAKQWFLGAERSLSGNLSVSPMPVLSPDLLPPDDRQCSAALYNGMIHPVCPFPLRGIVWYQGENNYAEGVVHAKKMKALIGSRREAWGDGDSPLYYVQLASYNYGGNPEVLGEFWEAQSAVQCVTNADMVVLNDIGNLKDIHPDNKQEVRRRLALLALAKTYGEKEVMFSGPTFKEMLVEGDKIRILFDNVSSGVVSRDGKPLRWFEIIDEKQGVFVKADATIDGSTVVLSNLDVSHPVAMRFAWSMLAKHNLINSEGLPAGSFRAGVILNHEPIALSPQA